MNFLSDMLFNAITPCKNCPYRKDAPLALWDRSEFQNLLEQDKEQFGKVYGCHKNDKSVCRGYLMDQDARNFPNITLRMTLLKEGVTRVYLDRLTCSSDRFDSIQEMAEANFPGITDASANNKHTSA